MCNIFPFSFLRSPIAAEKCNGTNCTKCSSATISVSKSRMETKKRMRLMYVFVVNRYQKYKIKVVSNFCVFISSSLLSLLLNKFLRRNVFMPFTFSFHCHKTQAIYLMPALASSNDQDVLLNWKKKVKSCNSKLLFYKRRSSHVLNYASI